MASKIEEKRIQLCKILEGITMSTDNVYFEPPPNYVMVYPCIRVSRESIYNLYADNMSYLGLTTYSLTVIDRLPDNEWLDKIIDLRYCSYDRHYVADGLHHDVFSIYY